MNELINKLGGIAGIGLFSLCVFVLVFSGSIALAFCLKKPFLKSMGELPLQDAASTRETPNTHPL
jgi:hypothetical protein